MVWDYHQQEISTRVRSKLSLLITPIFYIANAPFAFVDFMSENIRGREALFNENTSLRAQALILQGQLQRLQSLQLENQQLHELLQSSPVINHVRLLAAQVLAVNTNPFHQELILNKGTHHNAFVGQAVLDAYGIMGQVIEVSPYTCRIMLLTDPRSGIPIKNSRTGQRGILTGRGNIAHLDWIDMPATADIKIGDLLMSSGLDGRYPVGYPVGVVSKVNPYTNDQFLQIHVTPSAHIDSSEQVLLIWSDKKEKP